MIHAYEKLPKKLKKFLSTYPETMTAEWALEQLEEYRLTEDQLLDIILMRYKSGQQRD